MKRDKHISIALTEEEFQEIIALAMREERTPSDTARRLIKKGLEQAK